MAQQENNELVTLDTCKLSLHTNTTRLSKCYEQLFDHVHVLKQSAMQVSCASMVDVMTIAAIANVNHEASALEQSSSMRAMPDVHTAEGTCWALNHPSSTVWTI